MFKWFKQGPETTEDDWRSGRPSTSKRDQNIEKIVIPICMVQAGDIIKHDGTSGESIYGPVFEDEKKEIQHTEPGMVGMANTGPNTNHSQFYITTVPCPHLDDINVIVGRVVKGLNILVEMADIPRENDKPLEKIWIENCGQYKHGDPIDVREADGTEDVYPPWPNDWDLNPLENYAVVERAVTDIKNSGNHFYQKQNYIDSERKYVKTLRYIDWYLCNKRKSNYRSNIENLRLISMLNLSAVKLKRNKYKEVIELCDEVSEDMYDSRNN
ncbi:hypothetical protein NQ318_023170 [Aromia moschata]|uniref:Peptidyl-prolyl cis-trans isomerase n=1 Tax=Aromia moschata TaxID=1265417 RepID=A0AAV8Y064_9CUCU|nr:hypothetical protein NQ318_023170 [Aromia moschata]